MTNKCIRRRARVKKLYKKVISRGCGRVTSGKQLKRCKSILRRYNGARRMWHKKCPGMAL